MKLSVNGKSVQVNVLKSYSTGVSFEVNGKIYLVEREASGSIKLGEDSKQKSLKNTNTRKTDSNIVTAPISGLITTIGIKIGDQVTVGTELVILEAMKMQNKIFAGRDGVVEEILVSVGDEVSEGAGVLRFRGD